MQWLVRCADCGLKYGEYSTFHLFPECVERERRRHNCRLIQLCRRWEQLVRGPFYWDPRGRGQCDGDPPDANEQAAMVDAEDAAAEVRAVFAARTAAYMRTEARACSWTFAAARANRKLWLVSNIEPVVEGLPPAVQRATVGAHAKTTEALWVRAVATEHAVTWALADLAAKARALDRAMDAVEHCAREAGVFLPPRRPVRVAGVDGDYNDDDCGRIVFEAVYEADRDSGDSEAEDESEDYGAGISDDDGDDYGSDFDDEGRYGENHLYDVIYDVLDERESQPLIVDEE